MVVKNATSDIFRHLVLYHIPTNYCTVHAQTRENSTRSNVSKNVFLNKNPDRIAV